MDRPAHDCGSGKPHFDLQREVAWEAVADLGLDAGLASYRYQYQGLPGTDESMTEEVDDDVLAHFGKADGHDLFAY